MPKCKAHPDATFDAKGRCRKCASEASKRSREKRLAREANAVSHQKAEEAEAVLEAKLDAKIFDPNYRRTLPLIEGRMYYIGRSEDVDASLAAMIERNPEADRIYIDEKWWSKAPFQIGNVLVTPAPVAPKCALIGSEVHEAQSTD